MKIATRRHSLVKAKLEAIDASLAYVRDLLDNDDGRRWPPPSLELEGTSSEAKSKGSPVLIGYDRLGDPVTEDAHEEYALSTCAPAPHPVPDPYDGGLLDQIAEVVRVEPRQWVKVDRATIADEAADELAEGILCCFGMSVAHRVQGRYLWLKWDGTIVTTRLDMRIMTVNMRKAERQLLGLQRELHETCRLLYDESQETCDLRRASLAAKAVSNAAQQAMRYEQHYRGHILSTFDRLDRQIEVFEQLRRNLFRKIRRRNVKTDDGYLYAHTLQRIPPSKWLVIAHLKHPRKVIRGRGRRVTYASDLSIWANFARCATLDWLRHGACLG